jgi:hypothetical protein
MDMEICNSIYASPLQALGKKLSLQRLLQGSLEANVSPAAFGARTYAKYRNQKILSENLQDCRSSLYTPSAC